MRRKKQSGWIYLCMDFDGIKRPDGDREGWYKVRGLHLNRGSKVTDNMTCPKQGCPCKKVEVPIRGKRGRKKAKGQKKHCKSDQFLINLRDS